MRQYNASNTHIEISLTLYWPSWIEFDNFFWDKLRTLYSMALTLKYDSYK